MLIIIKIGDIRESINNFDQAIDLSDENKLTDEKKSEYYYNKGFALYYLGKIEDSLKIYDHSLQLNNQNYLSLNGKGNCYFDMNNLEQALKFYNAALSIKKDYYLANFNKANCLYSKSEYKKALECYDDSFKILGKKNWEFDIENYNTILNEYELICPIDENTSAIYNNIGMCLLNIGKPLCALRCFDKAISINKGDALLLINKARVLSELGKRDETQKYVDLALDALKVPSVSLTKNLFVYVIKEIEELNREEEKPIIKNKKENDEEEEKKDNNKKEENKNVIKRNSVNNKNKIKVGVNKQKLVNSLKKK